MVWMWFSQACFFHRQKAELPSIEWKATVSRLELEVYRLVAMRYRDHFIFSTRGDEGIHHQLIQRPNHVCCAKQR